MKQTAVEWLVEQLINVNRKNYINNRILPISKNSIQDKDINQLFQQAKQMEKEQIKDAYWSGEIDSDGGGSAEQFYNKTYGKDNG